MASRPRLKLITLPWELEVPTLALASLAAVTPSCFDIAIVDLLREHLFLDEPVDLVGISASTPRVKAAYALADFYRARGVIVVMGGHHPTAMPEEALLHADAVVCGEGETAWVKICDQFLTNPSTIGGIYREPAPDLRTLPLPRVDLMKIDRYGSFFYPLIASRGCPEACSFCFSKRMTRGFRTYPIAHILAQVRQRPKWVRAAYFVDDNLPGDPEHTRELFRALAKENLPFGIQARIEYCQDPDDLHLAREAGCTLISSGFESINQMTLDRTGKQASATDYLAVIKNVFDAGMMPSGNWMFGFDWDTPDTFEKTLDFLDQSHLLHSSFTTEIPFPGTPAHRRYQAEGRLLTHDYDHYVGKDGVVVHPKQMSAEQLQAGVRWLSKQYYSPRRALRRSRLAIGNRRLGANFPRLLRAPSLAFLSGLQVWQWQYRMTPSLKWLYERLQAAEKHRYFLDHIRGTNFRSEGLGRQAGRPAG